MGKPKYEREQVIAALKAHNGMVYLAAEALHCTPQTIYNYARRYVSVQEAIDGSRGKVLDMAEQALYSAILNREAWAVAFALRTIGRHRGYVERSEQEITGKDGGPIPVQVIGIGGINPDDDI